MDGAWARLRCPEPHSSTALSSGAASTGNTMFRAAFDLAISLRETHGARADSRARGDTHAD